MVLFIVQLLADGHDLAIYEGPDRLLGQPILFGY